MSHTYDSIPGLRCSQIKHLLISPAHFKEAITNPKPSTKAQDFGHYAHMSILEPERFLETIFVQPEGPDGRTTEGKAFKAALVEMIASGKIFVSADEYFKLQNLALACKAHPLVGELLLSQDREGILTGLLDEVQVKGRYDLYCSRSRLLVDFKTSSKTLTERSMQRDLIEYGYLMQAAFYTDLAAHNGMPVKDFLFVFIETTAPFGIRTIYATEEGLEYGRKQYKRCLSLFNECSKSDSWPSYDIRPLYFTLPAWIGE